jgi:glucokinase
LSQCELPDIETGSFETVHDLQRVEMYPDWDAAVSRLAAALRDLSSAASDRVVEALAESPGEQRSAEQVAALGRAIAQGTDLYMVMDLGGTKAYVSLMTNKADSLFDKRFMTKSHKDPDGLLRFIKACIREAIDDIHELTGTGTKDIERAIKAIGIAFPGPTDPDAGLVLDASNFDIKNFPLRDKVQTSFGIPTFIDNDVNLSAWGEAWKGAAKGYDNLVVIMIGTGIGGGIIIDGEIYRGRNKTAGEIGHMILNHDGHTLCGCGQKGCFEALASRKSIARDLNLAKAAHRPQETRKWSVDNLLSNQIAEYYKAGDPDAVEAVTDAGKICGKAVFSILNLLNPEIIVFNGGFVQQLGDEFLVPVRAEATQCMNAVYSLGDKKIPIVVGTLPNPVLVGACRMAIEGRGIRVRPDWQQLISTLGANLAGSEHAVLDDLYRSDGPIAISRQPTADYGKDSLRNLRNRGLIRTDRESFRTSRVFELTDLGRIFMEEAARHDG